MLGEGMATKMEGIIQETPLRADSRFADYEDDCSDVSAPKTGMKRLFSKRGSRFADSDDYGENDEAEAEEAGYHSGKRYRNCDWPLPNTASANTSPRTKQPLRSQNAPASSSPRGRPTSYRAYPSRFIEGSMNDRVSQKPPTPYIGDEELQERYYQEDQNRERKIAQPRKSIHRQSRPGPNFERPDTTRHSSIFRFGKSIAANFNPVNWKIWSKSQQEEAETPEQKVLRERRERAESIYLELKRNGQFRDAAIPPVFKSEEVLAKHDSGIVLTRPARTSGDSYQSDKRNGIIFLDTPQIDALAGSPGSNVSGSVVGSARNSGINFKKPFLSRRKSADSDGGPNAPHSGDRQARRIPSRKDLQKQQKLVKRVSNLEMRLEAARRQLSDALSEPLPTEITPMRAVSASRLGRQRFVPGALATLPSERLLAKNETADDEEPEKGPSEPEVSERIGRALTKDESMKDITASNHLTIDEKNRAGKKEYPEPISGENVEFGTVEILSVQAAKGTGKDRSVRASTQASETTRATTASEASTQFYEPTGSSGDEDELVRDMMDDLVKKPVTKKSPPMSKKQTSFERVVDKSGAFQPDQKDESENGSEDEEIVTPKTSMGARRQKLQKPTITLTHGPKVASHRDRPVKKASSPLNRRSSLSQTRQQPIAKAASRTASTVSRQHSKLQKSQSATGRSTKGKPAMSPPLSAFTGEDLEKPSPEPNTHSPTHNTYTPESDIPPVPPLPAAVRLASGEIINTTHHQATKLTKLKVRRAVKASPSPKAKDGMKRDKSFEWPADVF